MSDHLPDLTDHAAARWRARTPAETRIGPLVAWEQATTIGPECGLEGDEVRYHPPTSTALVRKDSALVTVIRVDRGAVPGLQRAVRQLGDVAAVQRREQS